MSAVLTALSFSDTWLSLFMSSANFLFTLAGPNKTISFTCFTSLKTRFRYLVVCSSILLFFLVSSLRNWLPNRPNFFFSPSYFSLISISDSIIFKLYPWSFRVITTSCSLSNQIPVCFYILHLMISIMNAFQLNAIYYFIDKIQSN